MAEEPADDDSTEYETVDDEEEPFDDDALRGFRFFTNNISGQAHDAEDIQAEDNMEANEEFGADDNEPDPNVPTTDFVAQKLREQGVTFEQLVRFACYIDHQEYDDDEEADRFGDELFGKIRIIVSNYQPQQAQPVQPEPPKQETIVSIPRLMSHV